jgi:hypothetical protein
MKRKKLLKITLLSFALLISTLGVIKAAGINVSLSPNESAVSTTNTLDLTFVPVTTLNNADTITIIYPTPDVYDDSSLDNSDISISKPGDANFVSGNINVNISQNTIDIQLSTLGSLDSINPFQITIDDITTPSSPGSYSLLITTSVGDKGAALHYIGDDNDVVVTANITTCTLTLTIHPEKRIPTTNNWQTDLHVEVYDNSEVYYGDFTLTTNNMGVGTVNLCSQGVNLTTGSYDFYIRGLSHLRKEYTSFGTFNTAGDSIDFTIQAELTAGETSIVYDNFINTLDLSTQVTNLETVDIENDLNQDGEVNILDVSNSVTNFYLEGDCSPQEDLANVCN